MNEDDQRCSFQVQVSETNVLNVLVRVARADGISLRMSGVAADII